MNKFKYIVTCLLLMAFSVASAQVSNEKFGRNRLQYKQFEWHYLSSDNFDVYFYRGSEKIAREVSEFLEEEFDKVTDIIGYPPYFKTKVFLYNSISDLQQSNVGIGKGTFTPGGETNFVKPYIEVANPGTVSALKEELLVEVATLMVNEMMFGGSLKDMFQSAVLLNLPEWFISGAALYVAKGWTIEMDDYARKLVETKHARKFNRLTGKEAALAGQSLWNFIAHKYGRSNISNILNYTRIIRNEEKSLTITLGVSFEQLMFEWQNFYIDNARQVQQNYETPSFENSITGEKNRKGVFYNAVKISPDGKKVAFTENNHGRYKVIVKEIESGNENIVLRGGYKVIGQEIDYSLPVLDWADDNTLGVIYSKLGQMNLLLYDLQTNSSIPRVLERMEQVRSMEFSSNGRLIVVSAVVGGRNDIYLLSTRRDRTKRLTNDVFDDIDPSFVPNSSTIVFSSNRVCDTLDVKKQDIEEVSENYNLFFFDLDTTKNILHRVTNTISKDVQPMAISANKIYYISDQRGIRNLFSYDIQSGIYSQVTNLSQSIDEYDLNFNTSLFAYSSTFKGNDFIYLDENFNYNQQTFTPQTMRQQVLQAKAFTARRQANKTEGLTIEQIVEQRLQDKRKRDEEEKARLDSVNQSLPDTVSSDVIDTKNYTFDVKPEPEAEPEPEEEIINTDNYTFDSDILREERPESFLAQYRQTRQGTRISGPFDAETRFSVDNLLTSFVIDPLRGFGVLLEVEMNDMLENHKFNGGVTAITDLRSGDFFGQYQYLKSYIDFSARVDRNVIFWENDFNLQQYSKNSIELGASIPFNTKTRFSLKPFYTFTVFENLLPRTLAPPSGPTFLPVENEDYIGGAAEFVFDNSIINGMNLIEGSRAKISLKHYESLNNKERSFSNFKADLRHYQKLHREIVLAFRGFYGTFFGRAPKTYLLGGVDNWILRDQNEDGRDNPLQNDSERTNPDLLFVEYATALRGFDYAEFYGNNVLMFNAELRVPIVRYLSGGPISSNFFRNLQFTGFFDIGSAWSGKSPFSDDNSISNVTIEEGGFQIDLRNFQNPWLYSYGVGFRTMILGYYMKLDVAWPVEDFVTQDVRYQVSLGYDF
ncbi:TolB-like translocation protein [Fulvivirga lutea]|uniref:PD40 domain-containing protein n=1 Tax=Fulvivirga lutea TaxID=2810512 RepID=A0A974WG83_9BACT|nr:PD40 domain-containing protein [Fulvivirga lutea]QSE97934.1 PD40 domain-containing protein [Fulvivirga lutea]